MKSPSVLSDNDKIFYRSLIFLEDFIEHKQGKVYKWEDLHPSDEKLDESDFAELRDALGEEVYHQLFPGEPDQYNLDEFPDASELFNANELLNTSESEEIEVLDEYQFLFTQKPVSQPIAAQKEPVLPMEVPLQEPISSDSLPSVEVIAHENAKDNSAVHTEHIAVNWCRDQPRSNRLELPPRSPEINIIEPGAASADVVEVPCLYTVYISTIIALVTARPAKSCSCTFKSQTFSRKLRYGRWFNGFLEHLHRVILKCLLCQLERFDDSYSEHRALVQSALADLTKFQELEFPEVVSSFENFYCHVGRQGPTSDAARDNESDEHSSSATAVLVHQATRRHLARTAPPL
ncbi:unnamed protein product [Trichogramma brassicae]|uniref:Uncharacterized protein n=1 Tax=Trichogramma brassicae TaxID=86971 RepID=A0A6H5I864_9HYME|nr:unnamed protein product [Trichogramma brassicae]